MFNVIEVCSGNNLKESIGITYLFYYSLFMEC